MCNPGVGVRLVRGGGGGGGGEKGEKGEDVMCELQVDWMYAQVYSIHTTYRPLPLPPPPPPPSLANKQLCLL